MKAQEYIKKYGITKAKELVSSVVNTISVGGVVCDPCFITDEGEHIGYNDLKRVVDSYDMVESKGGLIKAKEILADNPVWCYGSKRYSSPLERAIADVESCK